MIRLLLNRPLFPLKYITFSRTIASRSIFVFVMLLLLNGCCPKIRYLDSTVPFFTNSFAAQDPSPVDTIKVVSFNIEYGKRMELAVKEFNNAQVLRNADIILLQEIDENDMRMLAKSLKLNSVYYPSVQHVHGENFGNGVFARWSIQNHGKIILPHPNPICGHSRTAVFADIQLYGRLVRIYSTHTEVSSLGLDKRVDQFKTILSSVPDSIGYVIIGGDFNTMAGSTAFTMDSLALKKCFRRATRDIHYTMSSLSGVLKFNLDHIYVRGFSPLESGIYKDSKSSDHKPLWTKIRIEE